jgi:hypothetical protein
MAGIGDQRERSGDQPAYRLEHHEEPGEQRDQPEAPLVHRGCMIVPATVAVTRVMMMVMTVKLG